jgi:hypothetical protein
MPPLAKTQSASASPANGKKVNPKPKQKWPLFTKKYGTTVRDAGIVLVPRVLLTGVADLKLKPIHMLVLLQLIACWGNSGSHPYPKRKTLCKWLGCDKRTLDRAIAGLVKRGLIAKGTRNGPRGRQTSNEYDLSGLVEQIKPLGRRAIKERERKEAIRAATAHGG